ncbi:MAG: uroporphyrinogen-III synthase [Xanthobacteraceae bacterium]|nr:uroporphyrinogen-III synthase [Xanthobacteraceae bacterium]
MAVLVTRPAPDHETTAAALRGKGFDVLLAPMLRFEPVPFDLKSDAGFDAVLATSANALRALAETGARARLLTTPLYAVGGRTAQAARDLGFAQVAAAAGDGASLRDLVVAQAHAGTLRKAARLLYLAAADRAVDLEDELSPFSFDVVTVTAYRMIATSDLPADVRDAFAAGRVEAVLHYSGRSAHGFVAAARAAGVEITALAVPHCCISANVAAVLREAGATRVAVAATPDEDALFAALARAPRPQSR